MPTSTLAPAPVSDTPIALWPEGVPGAHGHAAADIPSILPWLSPREKATGAGLLVCPGGGYNGLAPHEGEGYAQFFRENGISAFVLNYRLRSGGYGYPEIFLDVARAMRYLRAHAAEWGIDRIGIIGSSAGGHLASMLLTHFDAGKSGDADPIEHQSSRPDFGILCYPVISMTDRHSHGGSRDNLLGPNPAADLAKYVSSELQVTADTPPCFLFHTWEDTLVLPENSILFANALRKHGIRFDLHIYEAGGHGMGLGSDWYKTAFLHPWTRDCLYWLKLHNLVK